MIVGLTILRNEDWVAGYSLRVALQLADHIVVLLHACEDKTARIVEMVSRETGRLSVLEEHASSFDEMDYRQLMLEKARKVGGCVMVLLDGDEILSANVIPQVRRRLGFLPPGGVFVTPILNLWRSLDWFRNDSTTFGKGRVVLAFGDVVGATWKPRDDGYQFHQRLPAGPWLPSPMKYPEDRLDGGLMHLQHASWRRLLAKQAWYQAVETLRWPHRDREKIRSLYSRTVAEEDIHLDPVPAEWWAHGLDRGGLILPDQLPWQEVELRRLLAEHGAEVFDGLDLFGVA